MQISVDVRNQGDCDQLGLTIDNTLEIAKIHNVVFVRHNANVQPLLPSLAIVQQAPAVMKIVGHDVTARHHIQSFKHDVFAGLRAGRKADLRWFGIDQLGEHFLDLAHQMPVFKFVARRVRTLSQGCQVLFHGACRMDAQRMFGGRIEVGFLARPREIGACRSGIRKRSGGRGCCRYDETTAGDMHGVTSHRTLHRICHVAILAGICDGHMHLPPARFRDNRRNRTAFPVVTANAGRISAVVR